MSKPVPIPAIIGILVLMYFAGFAVSKGATQIADAMEHETNDHSPVSLQYDDEPAEQPSPNGQPKQNNTMQVTATAYGPECGTGDGYTATGTRVRPGVVAVDPQVIPYGSKLKIEGFPGLFFAEDTGSDIRGPTIDIFMESQEEALEFGRQQLWVTIISD